MIAKSGFRLDLTLENFHGFLIEKWPGQFQVLFQVQF
jgi:hypothetical protein